MDINTRHIDQFLRLRSIADILERRFFKDTREITESMALYSAAKSYFPNSALQDTSIRLVEVTNSSRQRTAGLFVFLTRWECAGVGQNLGQTFFNAARLHTFVGDVSHYSLSSKTCLVCVAIDPRFSLGELLENTKAPEVLVITLTDGYVPSGFRGFTPTKEYTDPAVFGDRNVVKMYHFRPSDGWVTFTSERG